MKELPNPEKQTGIYASLYCIIFEKKEKKTGRLLEQGVY